MKDETLQSRPGLIVVTGPTATGKTSFAANLAYRVNGEIISADSRQVYRGMNLSSGKDLSDYIVGDCKIPVHLVDIVDPGYEYSVYEFQKDFLKAFRDIEKRGKTVILCGGTGLYIEAVLNGYSLLKVPENKELRDSLHARTDNELTALLHSFKRPHNVTDFTDRRRLIRAIEIQVYMRSHPGLDTSLPQFDYKIFGIWFTREQIRKRITERLKTRLESGMADEVTGLLNKGLTPDQIKFYGLEFRYLTQYVTGELSHAEMFRLLNTAIHQFAKRQMTWFRKMERNGLNIQWIDGELDMAQKIDMAISILNNDTGFPANV
jgi:tRNA dimethylallyltransferase